VRAVLRFIIVAALVVTCLLGLVVVSYRFNWPWLGSVPGAGELKPYAQILWDWLMVHLLVVIAVLIAGLVLLRLTGIRRKGRVVNTHHPRKGWFNRLFKKRDHGADIARQHGLERSPEWPRVEQEHRLREPRCVACGYKGRWVQVHHIKPFHIHPQLELDPDNLITLCQARGREHHLLLGHLGEWGSYNERVRSDARHFYRKTAAHIRADTSWQRKMQQRP
jgi:hypothetical protein